jgi:two-component system cell cycle response regulator
MRANEEKSPMKVLVIEDDPTDRKLMVALLQMSGHIVRESMTAEAALDAIVADNPDVILLDLRLPGMDGLTLVRRLKANAGTSQLPIVAVTAYPGRYRRDELLAAGCQACIIKPIDTRGLAKQLEDVSAMTSQ